MLIILALLLYKFMSQSSSLVISPTKPPNSKPAKPAYRTRLLIKAQAAKSFAAQKGFCSRYAFMIDMGLPSGQNRFFICDLQKNAVLYAGLVAHGSCNTRFLETAQFSNRAGCGCSSVGRYKVGGAYEGRFGKSFKLFGLDSTNSNAYQRAVVLHGYSCVPDAEPYPMPICNSLGCTMVSYKFLSLATGIIEKEKKPILLWVYN